MTSGSQTSLLHADEIEHLEHVALDPRPWREWGHSGRCEWCYWELQKEVRIAEFRRATTRP